MASVLLWKYKLFSTLGNPNAQSKATTCAKGGLSFFVILVKNIVRGLLIRTANGDVVELSEVHPLHSNEKLCQESRHQLSHKHGSSGVWGYPGIVLLVHFGVDIRVVGDLRRLIEAIEHLHRLQSTQSGGPEQSAPNTYASDSIGYDYGLVPVGK